MVQGAVGTQDQPRRWFLWREVIRARATLSELVSRARPGAREDLMTARHRLLVALEAYAVELSSHGRPIPYQLRDEIRLCRLTLGSN